MKAQVLTTVFFSKWIRICQGGEDGRQLWLHQNQRSPKAQSVRTRAEQPGKLWNADGAAYRLSPVWSTLTPDAGMSLFKRRIVMCIGRQGRLVMIALLWLSATENKVFILCQSDVSSLISPMRPPPSPLSTTPPHPLNLLSWFGITVQRHGLLVQPATITANEERCGCHWICFLAILILYCTFVCKFHS